MNIGAEIKKKEEQVFVRRLCLEQIKMMLQFLTRDWHQIVVLGKKWEYGLIMLFVIPNITSKYPIMQGNQNLKRAQNNYRKIPQPWRTH